MCVSVGVEVEGVLVEQFLEVVGWSPHSRGAPGHRDRDVLAGCAA